VPWPVTLRSTRTWCWELVEAADYLRAFSCHFLRDLPIDQVQIDELFEKYNLLHA
jgi:hypothetical protein